MFRLGLNFDKRNSAPLGYRKDFVFVSWVKFEDHVRKYYSRGSNNILNIFLTGYDAEIPGHDNYRMIGDSDHGVFNLQIKNISLEDDAEFECQVGPNRTLNVNSIRAAANLTVLCEYHFVLTFASICVNRIVAIVYECQDNLPIILSNSIMIN